MAVYKCVVYTWFVREHPVCWYVVRDDALKQDHNKVGDYDQNLVENKLSNIVHKSMPFKMQRFA